MHRDKLQIDLEYVTQKRTLPEGDTLVAVLSRLDGYLADSKLPERLEHYLSKRSYAKALEWLADPSTPHHQ